MKKVKPSSLTARKTKLLFVASFLSIFIGLSLFLCGILLAFFFDQGAFYLMAFGGLPFLWLGSFLWRSARNIPSNDDLPPPSGSVTCGVVDVPKTDATNIKK